MLALTGVLLGSGWSASPAEARVAKGFWGATEFNGASEFPVYDDLGVEIYQMALRWNEVAPTKPAHQGDPDDPAYRWPAGVDDAIREARKHGMRVLLMIIGSPPWANGGKEWRWSPKDPGTYATFARAASRRYPDVHLWQVWGEPSRAPNWQPLHGQRNEDTAPLTKKQAEAPRRYARLLDAAYGQLKRQSRRNLVLGGSTYTAGDIKPVFWVRNLRLPGGRPPRMDLYAHNPFTMRKPDLRKPPLAYGFADFSDLDWFNRLIDRNLARGGKRHIRLFLGEFNLSTAERDLEFSFWVTPETQATWIKSGFRVARQVGAYAFGWIHLRDDPPDPQGAPVRHTGLIFHDGERKPGYFAFKRG